MLSTALLVLIVSLICISIALLFFFVGRWSLKPHKAQNETIDDIIDTVKKTVQPKPHLLPGVIPFKTPEEREDERTGETALDQHWKDRGMEEVLKQ